MEPAASRGELRRFGLTMGLVIAPLFGLLLPWLFGQGWPRWPWLLAGAFAVLALLLPVALRPVQRAWMTFGHAAGWVNVRLVLGLVFFAFFTPAALLMRLLGRDPLRRELGSSAPSYRVARTRAPAPSDLERPF